MKLSNRAQKRRGRRERARERNALGVPHEVAAERVAREVALRRVISQSDAFR